MKTGAPQKYSEADNLVAQTRRALGISQVEFARKIGLTHAAVSLLENGRRQISGPVRVLCQLLLAHPELLP